MTTVLLVDGVGRAAPLQLDGWKLPTVMMVPIPPRTEIGPNGERRIVKALEFIKTADKHRGLTVYRLNVPGASPAIREGYHVDPFVPAS